MMRRVQGWDKHRVVNPRKRLHRLMHAVIMLVVCCVVMTGCGNNGRSFNSDIIVYDIDDPGSIEVVSQSRMERIYSEWSVLYEELDHAPSIGRVDRMSLVDDYIFLYDTANMVVTRHALSGGTEVVYGEGRGQGPGEFVNIYSFGPRMEKDIWIVDSMTRRVSRFDWDGTYLNSFTAEYNPARIIGVGNDRLAILMYMQPALFALVDEAGHVEKRIAIKMGEPISLYTPVYDGQLFQAMDGGFIWAPRFASYLFFFNDSGELERRLQLIDGHDFPENAIGSSPASEMEHPSRTMSVSIDEGNLFVSTRVRTTDSIYHVVDRYDLATGQYIDSAHMPNNGSQYQVHNGQMYAVIADTTFGAFSFSISH